MDKSTEEIKEDDKVVEEKAEKETVVKEPQVQEEKPKKKKFVFNNYWDKKSKYGSWQKKQG